MAPDRVLLPRLGLLVGRDFVRVLHRQRRGQHTDRVLLLALAGRDDARDARVQRQPRQLAAERRQTALVVECAEHLQQPIAFGDVAVLGCVDPGEVVDIAQAQRRHLQDHAGQVGSQHLRVGEQIAALEIRLGIQAQAGAGTDTAATAGALVRRRLTDALDLQLLHAEPRRVAVDARGTGVDDVADAWHRDRGFSDVGGQHDARRAAAAEHAVLLFGRQPRIQRQHFGLRKAARQGAHEVADFALAGQKHQHVTGPATAGPQLVDAVGDLAFQIQIRVGLAIAHRHREGAAFDLEDRRRAARAFEVLGQPLRVQRRRRHDQLQVRPARQQPLEPAEQEVDIETALVRLVDDDRVVGGQLAVALQFGQQNAVGHQLDQAGIADAAVEARLVADQLAQRAAQLLRDARGDAARGQAAWLRVADQPACAAPQLQTQFGQLRGLARPGLAAQHDHLVLQNRATDLLARLAHRQFVREVDHRRLQAQPVLGLEQRGVEVAHQPLAIDRLPAVGAAQQAAEPAFVGDQQMLALLLEALDQLGRQGGNSGGGTAVQSRYRSG